MEIMMNNWQTDWLALIGAIIITAIIVIFLITCLLE